MKSIVVALWPKGNLALQALTVACSLVAVLCAGLGAAVLVKSVAVTGMPVGAGFSMVGMGCVVMACVWLMLKYKSVLARNVAMALGGCVLYMMVGALGARLGSFAAAAVPTGVFVGLCIAVVTRRPSWVD